MLTVGTDDYVTDPARGNQTELIQIKHVLGIASIAGVDQVEPLF